MDAGCAAARVCELVKCPDTKVGLKLEDSTAFTAKIDEAHDAKSFDDKPRAPKMEVDGGIAVSPGAKFVTSGDVDIKPRRARCPAGLKECKSGHLVGRKGDECEFSCPEDEGAKRYDDMTEEEKKEEAAKSEEDPSKAIVVPDGEKCLPEMCCARAKTRLEERCQEHAAVCALVRCPTPAEVTSTATAKMQELDAEGKPKPPMKRDVPEVAAKPEDAKVDDVKEEKKTGVRVNYLGCPRDVKACRDGTFVVRMKSLSCEFAACPETEAEEEVCNAKPEECCTGVKACVGARACAKVDCGDTRREEPTLLIEPTVKQVDPKIVLAESGECAIEGKISGSGALSCAVKLGHNSTGAADIGKSILAPGNSPGTISADSVSLSSAAVTEIEIAGGRPGVDHDVIAAGSSLDLGGTLKVSLMGGYEPAVNTTYVVITADDNVRPTGAFAKLDTSALPDKVLAAVESIENEIRVVLFPKPPVSSTKENEIVLRFSGASVEDGLSETEIKIMVETLAELAGLPKDAAKAGDVLYQVKSSLQLSTSTDLTTAAGQAAVVSSIASSNNLAPEAVKITSVTPVAARRRGRSLLQSGGGAVDVAFTVSLSRAADPTLSPRRFADVMAVKLASADFVDALVAAAVAAPTVAAVAAPTVSATITIAVDSDKLPEGTDLATALANLNTAAVSDEYVDKLAEKARRRCSENHPTQRTFSLLTIPARF